MTEHFGPEISDLVVDYDPVTLQRRPVVLDTVVARLRGAGLPQRAVRAAQALGRRGRIDDGLVDDALVRAHLELQRLHEEFRVGAMTRRLLAPMLALVRRTRPGPIRVVDLGCGLGFVVRWLAACGDLGDDVQLIGTDYNRALITAAQRLAERERLRCRFVVANVWSLDEPADILISTGVLHHFRGADLTAFFAAHERSGAAAFVHTDIRPSRLAPLGAWIFHQARMREPLARFDGYWSARRAHDRHTLRAAAAAGVPGFALGVLDAAPGVGGMLRIFQSVVGARSIDVAPLAEAYAGLGRRYEVL